MENSNSAKNFADNEISIKLSIENYNLKFCYFSISAQHKLIIFNRGFSIKVTCGFLATETMKENYQTKVLRGTLWIDDICHLIEIAPTIPLSP